MASRLSDLTMKEIYDSGQSALPWELPASGANLLQLDLGKILADPDPRGLVQNIPPQILYHALKKEGPEACADVLPMLSREQFVRLFDYDVWHKDQLVPKRAFQWLHQFKHVGEHAMAARFQMLDEEYQLALIEKVVRVYDEEEVDRMPDAQRDQLQNFPGHQFFYRIDSDDPETVEFVQELVRSAQAFDMNYAVRVLTAAAFYPPHEAEALLAQFRKARLEEDGFVGYEEALHTFDRVDVEAMRARWGLATRSVDAGAVVVSSAAEQQRLFLEEVLIDAMERGLWTQEDGFQLQQGFFHLGNCLAAAARVEADNLEELNKILEQVRALLSLGLEYVCSGSKSAGLSCLKREYPKQLFQAGLSLIYQLQDKVLVGLSAEIGTERTERLQKLVRLRKWGEVQWSLDTELSGSMSVQKVETLKGLYNRFPMRPKTVVKDGVERVVFEPIGRLAAFADLQRTMMRMIKSEPSLN